VIRFPDFRQTKFLLTAFIITLATLMVLVSMVCHVVGAPVFVTFDSWWQVCLFILSTYSVADITNTHLQQKKQVPPEAQTS
jgi:hypothetical protein